jgi:hypothetical protein
MNKQAERVSSTLIRTGLARVQHLWERRFGRKLQGRRELLNYLCAERGKPMNEAEDMTLDEVADMLRPDPSSLDVKDQMILEVMRIGHRMNGREIADALDGQMTYETVRRQLQPNADLRTHGFIEKAGPQGYIRKM